ncbi:MAG: hypothetical protein KGI97_03480 [Alphaproteobacteria bacterium]|nr:hypothetical protein [Alphaproteobacteria bacterium]
MTDFLKKTLDKYRDTPFAALSPAQQADYLGAIARRGAEDALKALGLADENAAADIRDIRDLLRGLRVMKRAAWAAVFTAFGRMIGWAAVLALAALFLNGKRAHEFAAMIGF